MKDFSNVVKDLCRGGGGINFEFNLQGKTLFLAQTNTRNKFTSSKGKRTIYDRVK